MARARLHKHALTSAALLLRATPFADSDLIVRLFTERLGAVTALARGARKRNKRFSSLEPMHRLKVTFDVTPGREMVTLREARVSKPRLGLVTKLLPMRAAGKALSWLRALTSERTPEPLLWRQTEALLDVLDEGGRNPAAYLALTGWCMLEAAGWGLDLHACVHCRRRAPASRRVTLSVAKGGIVCRHCGGGEWSMRADERGALLAISGETATPTMGVEAIDEGCAELIVALVERAIWVHGRAAR
ncbi:MAG TPA: DNA repair protein RecO [Sorangium sp.]|nr:DNA repair protein RecO [Sorangium sp.]